MLHDISMSFSEHVNFSFFMLSVSHLGIKIINVFVDSKLITEQVRGNYRVSSNHLKPLFNEVKNLKSKFDKFKISHVLRHLNTHADRLANEALKFRPLI